MNDHSHTPGDTRGGDAVLGHVSQVASYGLPLAAALGALSEEVPSGRMRSTLRQLAARLEQGAPVPDAVASLEGCVPAHLHAMLDAGLTSGRLATILDEYLAVRRRTSELRTYFWGGLLYSILVLAAVFGVVVAAMVWQGPMFKKIYGDFGMELPWVTLWAIRMSDALVFLMQHWVPTVLTLSVIVVGAWALWVYLPGRALRTRVVQIIPVFGHTRRLAAMAEFCSMLAVLLDCRLPMPEALRLTGEAISDPNLQQGCRSLAEDIENGIECEVSAQRLPNFSRTLAHLLRWHARGPAIVQLLRSAADLFAAQARAQSGLAIVFLEPLILIVAGVVVGTLVVAFIYPLFNLMNALV